MKPLCVDVTSNLQSLHSEFLDDAVYLNVDNAILSAHLEWHSDIENFFALVHSVWHSAPTDTDSSFESCLKGTSLHLGTMVEEITA